MKKDISRNIWLTYVYLFFFFTVFFFPIIQLFFSDKGLTLTKIAFLGIALNIARLITEVPSGALSDKWGRIKTIRVIPLLMMVSFFFILYFPTFNGFLIAAIIFGVVHAFISGSIHSVLYDSLLTLKREKEFKKHLGKIYLFASIGGAITAAFSGYLYEINAFLPFKASLISIILVFITTFFFIEPLKQKSIHQHNYFTHIKQAFNDIRKSKELTFVVVYASFMLFIFIYIFDFGQVYLRNSQILIILIGVIYGVRLLSEGLGSLLAIKYIPTTKKSFLYLAILSFIVLGLWVFFPSLWVFFIAAYFFLGMMRILNMDFLHHKIKSSRRATIESIISFIIGLLVIILIVPLNYIGDVYGLFWSMLILVGINLGVIIYTLRT